MANTNPYLILSSPSSFTLATANGAKNWDGTLEYSTDLKNWATWDGTTTLSSSDGTEHVLYVRGTGNTYITGSMSKGWRLTGNNISCVGNIENLLDHETVAAGEHPSMGNDCYSGLFWGSAGLMKAPELPATTMTGWCYFRMFQDCTSLTKAPELPATTLSTGCYRSMFDGCSNLIIAPALPATTLMYDCYSSMFNGCTSLKLSTTKFGAYTIPYRVPSIGDGTTAADALSDMFSGTGGTFAGTPSINTTYYMYDPEYIAALKLSSPNEFTLATANSIKNWDGTLEYSTDLSTWNTWNGITIISSASLNNKQVLFIRGTNNTIITGSDSGTNNAMWVLDGTNISCEGNIENLLDYSTVSSGGHPSLVKSTFEFLFADCEGLIDASQLQMPSTAPGTYCYCYMFRGCINLISIPQLPATTLNTGCYQGMFEGCTNIKLSTIKTENYLIAYKIPSSGTGTIANNALLDMFADTGGTFTGTPDINTIYYLWVETYPDRALKFSSSSSFTLATANSAKNWDGQLEYSTDLANWDVWDGIITLNSSNESPYVLYLRGTGNTVISGGNWYGKGWTLTGSNISCSGNIENLLDYETVTAGEHPSMGDNCYRGMFWDCTNLTMAPELPATTLSSGCYYGMFSDCTSLTTAPKLPATTLASSCYASMFSGCMNLTTAPELPATTLVTYCYYYMFFNCKSLTTPPELSVTRLANQCCANMFNGCTGLTTVPELPTTTLAYGCYLSMFSGCTNLTTAPELPATTLADECYRGMFQGCSNLLYIPCLKANTLTSNCYNSMFKNIGLTISETKSSTTPYPYRVPLIGDGTTATDALTNMFSEVTGNIPTPEINKTYYLSHKPIGGMEVKEVKNGNEVIDVKHYHIYTDSTLTENAYTDSAFGAEALYDAYGMTNTEYNTLIALIG